MQGKVYQTVSNRQPEMFLWLDDDCDEDTASAVKRARAYFKKKYGKYPRRVVKHFPKYHYLLGPIPRSFKVGDLTNVEIVV